MCRSEKGDPEVLENFFAENVREIWERQWSFNKSYVVMWEW